MTSIKQDQLARLQQVTVRETSPFGARFVSARREKIAQCLMVSSEALLILMMLVSCLVLDLVYPAHGKDHKVMTLPFIESHSGLRYC